MEFCYSSHHVQKQKWREKKEDVLPSRSLASRPCLFLSPFSLSLFYSRPHARYSRFPPSISSPVSLHRCRSPIESVSIWAVSFAQSIQGSQPSIPLHVCGGSGRHGRLLRAGGRRGIEGGVGRRSQVRLGEGWQCTRHERSSTSLLRRKVIVELVERGAVDRAVHGRLTFPTQRVHGNIPHPSSGVRVRVGKRGYGKRRGAGGQRRAEVLGRDARGGGLLPRAGRLRGGARAGARRAPAEAVSRQS